MNINGKWMSEPEVQAYVSRLETRISELEDKHWNEHDVCEKYFPNKGDSLCVTDGMGASCCRCGGDKSLCDYGYYDGDSDNSMNLSAEAKAARYAYKRKWEQEHKDKVNAYQRKWRQKNPEKVKEYHARYWEKKADELIKKNRRTENG